MKLNVVFFCLVCAQLWSQDSRLESSFLPSDSLSPESGRVLLQYRIHPNRVLPIESYFRDRILTSASVPVPTFPVLDSKVGYQTMVMDNTRRYSTIGHYLYNRELVELKEDNNYLWITPLLDVSLGKDLVHDSLSRISQNTRGVRLEGNFNNRVFFSTAFFENQAVLPDYAAKYALSRGEFYPNPADSSYTQVNAAISGAARTKPFKVNGFDYAYAVGSLTVCLTGKMTLSLGNNSLFVGSGYRSMLWSDNSFGAMNLNFKWDISPKWSFQVVRMRGMNMMRRIGGVNGEAYYEPTSLSMSTLYFKPAKNFMIGLFEGGMWYRGDSISKMAPSALYFVPLPGVSAMEENISGKSNTVLGLDGNLHLNNALLYGQFALNPFVEKSQLFQAGVRLHHPKLVGSWLQLEYNQANQNAYTSNNPRMNYASYNLPLAHPAGTNFQEFLMRTNYEYHHFFVSASVHYYPKQMEQTTLLPIYTNTVPQTFQKVILTVIETGYKFNRNYGLEVFAQFRYRKSDGTSVNEASWVSAGLRTAIRNHYFDY